MRWRIVVLFKLSVLTALSLLLATNVSNGETVLFGVEDVHTISDGTGSIRLLLRFENLERLNGRKILYAKLYLDVDQDTCTDPFNELAVYPITKDWTPNSASWNAAWDSLGGNLGTDYLAIAPLDIGNDGLTEILITEVVQSWVNGSAEDYGLALVPIEKGCDYGLRKNAEFLGSGYGRLLVRYTSLDF